jgi:ATP-dependent Clp protease ATP-binding subunit ClpX
MDPTENKSYFDTAKNALIKQYTKLFLMDDVEFTINDEALDFIVDKGLEYKLGARGCVLYARQS